MSNVHIPDDVLLNILTRLPGKPLLRFRCVSTHWNCLISDPCFMKSRSRRMILLPNTKPLTIVDDNVPPEDKAHSIVRIPSPLENHHEVKEVSIVGNFNDMIFLVITDIPLRRHMYLYNPLTSASKLLFVTGPPSPAFNNIPIVFGFSSDDLKIVRITISGYPPSRYIWNVFYLKTSSWTEPQVLKSGFFFWCDVGIFLNGFLYWLISTTKFEILALDVEGMVFAKINLPPHKNTYHGILLSSLKGCLCVITKNDNSTNEFDMWVMKDVKNTSWLKRCSFTFGLQGDCFNKFHAMNVWGDGKILLTNGSNQLVIYDTSNGSYKMLNHLASRDDFIERKRLPDFKRIRSIEYVETLVSPSDIRFI